MNMITTEKKDIIVAALIASGESLPDLDLDDLRDAGITYNECDMILRQLEKMGFIDIKHRCSGSIFTVAVNSGLHDFSARGAFAAQELILSTQLERLDIEIRVSSSTFPKT